MDLSHFIHLWIIMWLSRKQDIKPSTETISIFSKKNIAAQSFLLTLILIISCKFCWHIPVHVLMFISKLRLSTPVCGMCFHAQQSCSLSWPHVHVYNGVLLYGHRVQHKEHVRNSLTPQTSVHVLIVHQRNQKNCAETFPTKMKSLVFLVYLRWWFTLSVLLNMWPEIS